MKASRVIMLLCMNCSMLAMNGIKEFQQGAEQEEVVTSASLIDYIRKRRAEITAANGTEQSEVDEGAECKNLLLRKVLPSTFAKL